MRLIDADTLIKNSAYESEDYNRETRDYDLPVVAVYDIKNAPSITTKEVKYFDEDEKVWKIGSVIADE